MPNQESPPREWPWLVLAVVCVVASPAAAYTAHQSRGWRVELFFGVQLVVTALAFLIPQARQTAAKQAGQSAAERELEARAEARATINDALDPILRQLGSISAERSRPVREELIAQAIPFVLSAAANLIGSERSRACWFSLTDESPARLVPRQHVGRSGPPTTTFETHTAAGDAAIGMVLRGEKLLCRDVETEPPAGWDATKERDYRTFISVSVIAGDTAYGMLTLDAIEAGRLNSDDLHMLDLMASALAAALAQHG